MTMLPVAQMAEYAHVLNGTEVIASVFIIATLLLPIIIIPYLYDEKMLPIIVVYYGAAVVGYLSHLLLDGLIVRWFRIRGRRFDQ